MQSGAYHRIEDQNEHIVLSAGSAAHPRGGMAGPHGLCQDCTEFENEKRRVADYEREEKENNTSRLT